MLQKITPESLKRGDLVALQLSGISVPMVKRAAAVPGDLVALSDGLFTVNGNHHEPPVPIEPNKWRTTLRQLERNKWVIPPRSLFVLGDNPDESIDSRKLGLISFDRVLGRVVKKRTE